MKKLKIGGVPEHFNMPWHLLLDEKKFNKPKLKGEWVDFPGGTGAMIEALNNNDVDIAMLLTEGAIKGIDQGGKYKILAFYVDSPLIWGIHVAAKSKYKKMNDVKGKTYAISRQGSGSQLMAIVDAEQRGWPTDKLKFKEVGNLDGARKALKEGKADIFLWEKYTTKKYVDNGEFRRIGECPTPYPCFVICASLEALNTKKKEIKKALKLIFPTCQKLKQNKDAVSIIADYYQLDKKDVKPWFKDVAWPKKAKIHKRELKKAMKILKRLGLIRPFFRYKKLVKFKKETAQKKRQTAL